MNIKIRIFLLILIAVLCVTCSVNRMDMSNISKLYDMNVPNYLYGFSLFHKENSTEIQFRVPIQEFSQRKGSDKEVFQSKFSLHYELYDDFRKIHLADSGTVLFKDTVSVENRYWNDYILEIPAGKVDQGELRIEIFDQNGDKSLNFPIFYNRKAFANNQYFYIEHIVNGRTPQTVLFTSDTFRLHISPLIRNEKIYVAYFSHFSDVANPPYAADWEKFYEWKPENIEKIQCDSGKTAFLNFRLPGIYHFMADTTQRNGFTVFITRPDFPFITNHDFMKGPIQYISTSREFKKLETNPDIHQAVESFWLSISSGPEAARKLIKDYYNRVQFANVFFTSYKEGWMTDRGMIYIVMGQPNIVYKSIFQEIWIYGQDKNVHSVSFEFRKVMNPFSDNDFILNRNPTYKDKWQMASDMWRK